MRAVAITIDTQGATTAGNFVQRGDHVDVIHTFRDNDVARANGSDGMVSKRLLHNVRILAIGQNIQKSGKEPVSSGSTATSRTDPETSRADILAQKVGQLSLSLRKLGPFECRGKRRYIGQRFELHHHSLRNSRSGRVR